MQHFQKHEIPKRIKHRDVQLTTPASVYNSSDLTTIQGMSTMLKPAEWINVREAAEIIGVSEGRVRQFLTETPLRFEAMKLNEKAWAIRRSSVIEFSKKQRRSGNPNFSR